MIYIPTINACTLLPRTILGVAYPAFASLQGTLSDTPEQFVGWLRYWVVLGVFSVVELLLDPLLNHYQESFPAYLLLKCVFLAWCMAPVSWNGSDTIFNCVCIIKFHCTLFINMLYAGPLSHL